MCPESRFQVSRSRGGRYACPESGNSLVFRTSMLEHSGAIVTRCSSPLDRSYAVVTRSGSKSPIENPSKSASAANASDSLETALSKLTYRHCWRPRVSPRGSSDRVLKFSVHLPKTLIDRMAQ
jgi:hypothetical protein